MPLDNLQSPSAQRMAYDPPSDKPRVVCGVAMTEIEQVERNRDAVYLQAKAAYKEGDRHLGADLWSRYQELKKRADWMRKGLIK